MAQPTVSVVIPAYRSERTIRRAIDSVLAQTVAAKEIIVVDDGSPDGQALIVEQYGAPVRLLRQANAGAAAARNRGIDHASGDFLAFLDADDYWEPQKLQHQLEIVRRFPQVGLLGGRFFNQQQDATRVLAAHCNSRKWLDRVLDVQGANSFRVGTLLWTSTILLRRELLAADRFVSGLEPAEDRDLWVRLAARTPTYLLSEPLATAVMEPGSLSRGDLERGCSNMLAVVARHRDLLGPSMARVWRSHTYYRWAALDPSPRTALPRLLHSCVLWPLPYRSVEPMESWGRLKRLVVLLLASCRVPRGLASGATS